MLDSLCRNHFTMCVNKGSADLVKEPQPILRNSMLKKIAAGAVLAGALAFSAAAPAVLSAGSIADTTNITAVGNWPDPMQPNAQRTAPAAPKGVPGLFFARYCYPLLRRGRFEGSK